MRRLLSLAVAIAGLACSNGRGAGPPPAEFLLSSADSSFWIAAGGAGGAADGEIHVRGAPIVLTRYDGRFYELYAVDDDFSYNDALLLGERLYRRDIATGDSTMLFADTAVARVAAAYARAHPDERPLAPDEEGEANPATSATAQLEVIGVFGPYISYEYHIDVDLPGSRPWHATRQGVIDLRTGATTRVADLFGADVARSLEGRGRQHYESMRDSILAERAATRPNDRRAVETLEHMEFDAGSFTLSSLDGQPAIAFGIPGRGEGAAGNVVELEPVKVDAAPWWRAVASSLPASDAMGNDRWTNGAYQVLVRYDTSGEIARIALADSARREWPVANVLGPLQRVAWLDRPRITDAERNALRRAFNSASSYDEGSRVAARPSGGSRLFSLAHASFQDCSRKPARNVRAHDARACEQHGARVRRRDSLDDGQVRRHLRVSAQPRERRHGLDRPRGLSRADSPRRSGRDEGQRQFRRAVVDGSRRAR